MTIAQFPGRPLAQEMMPNEVQHRRNIAYTANLAMKGQTNASASVTLDPNVTTTTWVDPRISLQTCISMMPTTANAAAALATTFVVCTAGQAVFTHASNAQTDRTFTVGIQG